MSQLLTTDTNRSPRTNGTPITRAERRLDDFAEALGVVTANERSALLVELKKMPVRLIAALEFCLVDRLGSAETACQIFPAVDKVELRKQLSGLQERFGTKVRPDPWAPLNYFDGFEISSESGTFSKTLEAKEKALAIMLVRYYEVPLERLEDLTIKWVTANQIAIIDHRGTQLDLDPKAEDLLKSYFQSVKDEGCLTRWQEDGSKLLLSAGSLELYIATARASEFDLSEQFDDLPEVKEPIQPKRETTSPRKPQSFKPRRAPRIAQPLKAKQEEPQRSFEGPKVVPRAVISPPPNIITPASPKAEEREVEQTVSATTNSSKARAIPEQQAKELWEGLAKLRVQRRENPEPAIGLPLKEGPILVQALYDIIRSPIGMNSNAVLGARLELELLKMRLKNPEVFTLQDKRAIELVKATLQQYAS